jgi:two-component system cell cycle response regulator
MENSPTQQFLTTLDADLGPLIGLTIADHYNDEPAISLVEQLQTTLEIDELLEIFSMEAAKIALFCGLTLQYSHQSIAVRGSAPGKHRLCFNLTLNDNTLGQLSYNLSEGLTKTAIRQLEKLHKQFLYPLRNALEFAKVKKLALKDALTGLNNRGHFDDSLNQAISSARRKRATFAMMMLDLDEFKQVNDTYGHQAGDEVIKALGKILHQSVRGDDTVFRLGGDEFAVIAQSQTETETQVVAARVQHNVANNPVMRQYGVSASIGFTFFKQNDSASCLYSRADSALYAAKDFGRNCTKSA